MRPTSSTRSSLREMSLVARQLGTWTWKWRGCGFGDPEFEGFQNPADLGGGHLASQLAVQPVERQIDRSGGRECRAGIGHSADHANPGRELLHQGYGPGEPAQGIGWILRFFKALGGVRPEADRGGGLAHAGGVEVRAFEDDARGGRGNRALHAADDSRDRDGAGGVGDHQVGRREVIAFLVQRVDLLAFARRAHQDFGCPRACRHRRRASAG